MAHKKSGGSARNGRDSAGKRLGVKVADGGTVIPGNIIVRQRGLSIKPGLGVKTGRDFTLFAVRAGTVRFSRVGRTGIPRVDIVPDITGTG